MYKQNVLFIKTWVIGIVVLFLGVTIFPCFNVVSKEFDLLESVEVQDETTVTCYVFDKTGSSESEVVLSSDVFNEFYSKFEELNHMITYHSFSDKTEVLKVEFVDLLDNMGLIPEDISKNDIIKLINPPIKRRRPLFSLLPQGVSTGRGSAFFCNFATAGEGSQFPVIILPRLIPILLTPIPRVIMHWNAVDGVTSCGGLLTGKGFIALGAQEGTALGFWGVGFSVFLPPVMSFGFIGYALFATATAEVIHPWPPNRAPVISEENPLDGSVDVPLPLSELSFRISDADGDRMNYTVSTDPYIGSGSGSNVGDGTFTVDVSGLNSNTEYSWRVVVDDGEDTIEETFSFHTAIEAPFVSDPLPVDGDSWVSIDLTELSFRLEDLQGDLMDYTVETVPDIGSDSVYGVGDGVYTVDVSDLGYTTDYTWFVNVTDGKFWTRRIFDFKTRPIMVFDPFDEGWQYRKQITIDHSQVNGDLMDFPVLVSLVDSDLRDKAQNDGDDILFMDGSGVANRLLHEIEMYDVSNGELVAWVNVNNLISTVDTVLYVYYGNPSCGSQQYPERVWDSNYMGVWHLNEGGTGKRFDSTSLSNDGTPRNYDGDESKSSIIYYGDDLDGDNDFIEIDTVAHDIKDDTKGTIVAWIKPDITPVNNMRICASDHSNDDDPLIEMMMYQVDTNWRIRIRCRNSVRTVKWDYHGSTNIVHDGNTWTYVVLVHDGTEPKLYVNGLLETLTTITENDKSIWYSGLGKDLDTAQIGSHWDGAGSHYGSFWKGMIDEVRISNTDRSDAWIETSYNTMNDPSGFFDVDPEESAP